MAFLMRFSGVVNAFLYDIKTLKIYHILSIMLSIALGCGALLAYVMHYYSMMINFGKQSIIVFYMPYVIFGILYSLVQLLKRQKQLLVLGLVTCFLPSTLTSEFGITADIFWGMSYFVYFLDKRHLQNIVRIVAMYSKKYSPLYEKRLENKVKYKQYQSDYRLLALLNVDDFNLISEEIRQVKNYKTGLSERTMYRTFKIKGILGKISIVDELYTMPRKHFWIKGI